MNAQPDGLYYPNRFVRAFLLALEEVMGKHGFDSLLGLAGLNRYIENLPDDSLERTVDFDTLAGLNFALDEMYGTRGGRGMALRAGRAWLVKGMSTFGALSGVNDPAFRTLPLEERTRLGLEALASIFTHFSDQRSYVEETPQTFRFVVENSPMVWTHDGDKPVCHPLLGLLQETVRWASNGRDYLVREVECRACGGDACVFVVNRQPL